MTWTKETVNDRGSEAIKENKDSFIEETKQVQLLPCSPEEEMGSWPSVVRVGIFFHGWYDLSSLQNRVPWEYPWIC